MHSPTEHRGKDMIYSVKKRKNKVRGENSAVEVLSVNDPMVDSTLQELQAARQIKEEVEKATERDRDPNRNIQSGRNSQVSESKRFASRGERMSAIKRLQAIKEGKLKLAENSIANRSRLVKEARTPQTSFEVVTYQEIRYVEPEDTEQKEKATGGNGGRKRKTENNREEDDNDGLDGDDELGDALDADEGDKEEDGQGDDYEGDGEAEQEDGNEVDGDDGDDGSYDLKEDVDPNEYSAEQE